jgi:hypothetical protein
MHLVRRIENPHGAASRGLIDTSYFPVVTAASRGMALRLRAKRRWRSLPEADTRTGKNCLCRTLQDQPHDARGCILRKGEMQSENQSPVAAFLFFVEHLP